jgi:dTDP-4-amino-4,6-dideoxygalactose transaminase
MINTLEVNPAVQVPFLDLRQQWRNLQKELEAAIWPILESASFIGGRAVADFEEEFAAYCDSKHAVSLDSGSAALQLALLALNIGRGDEVIVPTNTFIATAAAVHVVGATPVFVDTDERTWQMDPEKIRSVVSPRCKALIAVHLYGQPAAMDELKRVCAEHKLVLIEDAAQAHGATFAGEKIGSIGNIACFSFYPGKNLGAGGDGGMLTTDDAEIADHVRRLRDHGRITKYEHGEVGFNYRMDTIQAAILRVKLKYLDGWNSRRRDCARIYGERLASMPLRLPGAIDTSVPVHHLFPVCSPKRDSLAVFLKEKGIETGVHYPVPLHLQPAFRHLKHERGDFPVAERIADETLSLPIFPEMTEQQLDHVCHSIQEYFKRND